MKVLLVAPMVPDVDGSGAIPVLLGAELIGLGERHEVTLVTAVGDEPGEEAALARLPAGVEAHVADRRRPPPGARRLRRRLRMAGSWMAGRRPWRTVWFAAPEIQAIVDRLAERQRFDVAAVEDSAMSVFRYPQGVPTVYTHHEVLRPRRVDWRPGAPSHWGGWAFGELDWRRWAGFQRRAWHRFDRVQVFTGRDADTIAELAPEVAGRVRVNPFGLVLPDPVDPAGEVEGTVLFVGNFAHPPNRDAAVWLVREIMPGVRASRPEATLRIVGTAAPPEIRGLAGDGVEVVADAPDVAPHMEAAAVVLAPVRTGGGMRMKVLQALAAGKAVVTTARGTAGFASFDEGLPMVVGDSAEEIAAATSELLGDTAARRKLGAAARGFAERHHSPSAWAERLTSVYEEAAAERAERARA
jgi:glycosyltransferase involved in cell wall biosynthesis